MRALFSEVPEACDNTLLIAERCEVEFNTSANYMPRFPVPDGETEDSWMIKEVENGLRDRYPELYDALGAFYRQDPATRLPR